jgi:hypothetical protein
LFSIGVVSIKDSDGTNFYDNIFTGGFAGGLLFLELINCSYWVDSFGGARAVGADTTGSMTLQGNGNSDEATKTNFLSRFHHVYNQSQTLYGYNETENENGRFDFSPPGDIWGFPEDILHPTTTAIWREHVALGIYPDFRFHDGEGGESGDLVATAACVDLTTNVVSGLDHLEGCEVAILADGERLPNQVVSGGSINLSSSYGVVYVGLPIEADLETLNVEVPLKEGSIQATPVKISNAVLRLENSRGGFIGPDENNLYEAMTTDNLASAVQIDDEMSSGDARLFNCDFRVPLGGEYGTGGRLFIRQEDPLPITINSIIPEITVPQRTVK